MPQILFASWVAYVCATTKDICWFILVCWDDPSLLDGKLELMDAAKYKCVDAAKYKCVDANIYKLK